MPYCWGSYHPKVVRCAGSYLLTCCCLLMFGIQAFGQTDLSLPKMNLLRAEEDYSPLRGQSQTGLLAKLKFVPLGEKSFLSVGGEARYLTEQFHNNGWSEASGTNTWLLHRYMLHTDWQMGNFRVFGQLHSTWQNFTAVPPRGIDVDELDIHQLFAEYKIPLRENQILTARLGRQEFWLGSRRLVSVREGPNVRLAFDAARLYYTRSGFRVDAIYAHLVENEAGVFDNAATDQERWWGLYSVTDRLLGPLNVDLYYLGFHSELRAYDQGQSNELRHTVGTRFWKNGAFRVNAEVAYQFGRYGSGDIRAYTVSLDISKKLALPLSPTLGLKTELISGDQNRENEELQTFNAFYPRGAYFGLIALIGPANLIDIHPSVNVNLTNQLSFTFDWDIFWRHSLEDGIYGPNKALERSGQDSEQRFIGHQPGVELAYAPNRYLSFSLESSYFGTSLFFDETGNSAPVLHLAASTRFKF